MILLPSLRSGTDSLHGGSLGVRPIADALDGGAGQFGALAASCSWPPFFSLQALKQKVMSYSFTFAVGSPVIVRGTWPAIVQSHPGVGSDGDAVWWVRPLSGNRLVRIKESELRAMITSDIKCDGKSF